jgi:hypothetical protein
LLCWLCPARRWGPVRVCSIGALCITRRSRRSSGPQAGRTITQLSSVCVISCSLLWVPKNLVCGLDGLEFWHILELLAWVAVWVVQTSYRPVSKKSLICAARAKTHQVSEIAS